MLSISIIPDYKGNNVLREEDFDRERRTNEKNLEEKVKTHTNNNQDNNWLRWYSKNPITFTNEWPCTSTRDTLICFHINHNGINYHNDYLEWEMSLTYVPHGHAS